MPPWSCRRYPVEAKTLADLPEAFQCPLIGRRKDIIAELSAMFPNADMAPFSDVLKRDITEKYQPESPDFKHVLITEPDFTIYFRLEGTQEWCTEILMGTPSSAGAIDTVTRILDHFGLRAYDLETKKFFDGS